MTDKINPAIREQFEDYAYRQYEASRMAVMLTNGPEAMTPEDKAKAIPKHEYCAVNLDGTYKREALTLMWVGWKLCLDAQMPLIQMADLWRQWVEIQDRIARELPYGYEIRMALDKFDPEVDGSGLMVVDCITWDDQNNGHVIPHDDPVDLESPALFVRIFEAALRAAQEHHAKGLN